MSILPISDRPHACFGTCWCEQPPQVNPALLRREFEEHLDTCAQCREHPFALCRVGSILLSKAATAQTLSVPI
jgi:hypothetical protein